jgi:hypothetical protein
MIQIAQNEPEDADWKKWHQRVEEATTQLIKAHAEGSDPPEIKPDLYKGQRDLLLRTFNGKCAYCEVKLTAGQIKGDVDHYRPKGGIIDEKGQIVYVFDKRTNRNRPHPGYYWLAYEWWNLLPSCIGCNRPGRDLSGEMGGKWNYFPVSGSYALWPGEERSEEPLLLNPWIDNPNDHLKFDDELGFIQYRTPRGELTINLLKLNRDGLLEERRAAIDAVRLEAKEWTAALIDDDRSRSARWFEQFMRYKRGEVVYSAGRWAMVAKARARVDAAFGKIVRVTGVTGE